MRLALNNDAAGHPKTGPRRTLRAAKELKDLVPQRRYPVLGWPRCCLRNEFIQCSMTNLLNLTHTTPGWTRLDWVGLGWTHLDWSDGLVG